jgi:hypothetical protein
VLAAEVVSEDFMPSSDRLVDQVLTGTFTLQGHALWGDSKTFKGASLSRMDQGKAVNLSGKPAGNYVMLPDIGLSDVLRVEVTLTLKDAPFFILALASDFDDFWNETPLRVEINGKQTTIALANYEKMVHKQLFPRDKAITVVIVYNRSMERLSVQVDDKDLIKEMQLGGSLKVTQVGFMMHTHGADKQPGLLDDFKVSVKVAD